jgi:AraC-like DNA-binding protein
MQKCKMPEGSRSWVDMTETLRANLSWVDMTEMLEGVPNALVAGMASPCIMPRPHWHAQVEVNYVFEGGVRYRMATHDLHLSAGQFSMFWGGLPHQAQGNEPGTNFVAIHLPLVHFFRLRFSSDFADRITHGAAIVVTGSPGDAEAFRRMTEFMQSPDPLRREHGVNELLVRLGRLNFEPYDVVGESPTPALDRKADGSSYRSIVRICDFMTQNFRNDIHSSDIASSVDMHPKYAMSMFKRSTGMSLNEYLTLLRLSFAQALLMDGSVTILDVALESGFGTVGAFNQAFRKFIQQSPSEFRRNAALSSGPHGGYSDAQMPLAGAAPARGAGSF